MVGQDPGLHHFQRRKRIHLKKEKYPHPNKFKRAIDKLIIMVGLLAAIMTLPQLGKIWIQKNASGVSLISWIAYLITAIFWVIYGGLHKEKPLVLIYAVWIFLDIFIIIGIILYG